MLILLNAQKTPKTVKCKIETKYGVGNVDQNILHVQLQDAG